MLTTKSIIFNIKLYRNVSSVRHKYYKKHWNDNYRRERTRKVWPIDLPDFDYNRKMNGKLTPDEIRSKMKEKGIAPPAPWNERELYFPSSLSVIDPYVPETDGQSTSIAKRLTSKVLDKGKSLIKNNRALSKIQNYEEEGFNLDSFKAKALEIYIKAHEALAKRDEDSLFEYITERCFQQMIAGLDYKTVLWTFHEAVMEPEVVQVRTGELVSETNIVGQITVKLHSKQTLAIYDRHGRLSHGSPTEIREVVDYVVFEKSLADEYGRWRLHDRIKKQEAQPYNQITKTFKIEPEAIKQTSAS